MSLGRGRWVVPNKNLIFSTGLWTGNIFSMGYDASLYYTN